MSTSLIQGKYVIGKHSIVGDPRRKWEDRVYTSEIQRTNGANLIVGIVADGVGSADFGSRGAQLAIDTVVHMLEQSEGNDIPSILQKAIEAANHSVYRENQKHEGDGLTTLVVAVICKDRCYIGNVGDSRAYWIQSGGKGKLFQLTRDHSYFNIYGGDPNSEESGIVVNAIGKKAEVQVDLGLYLKGGDLEQAYKLGIAGLPMKAEDTILLCSDGLIKSDLQKVPYIQNAEIINALQTEYLPDRAAIKMVSTVEGRRPDDNVSVVTLQGITKEKIQEMESRSERAKQLKMLTRIGIGVVGVLVLSVIFFLLYKIRTTQPITMIVTATPLPAVPAGYLYLAQSQDGTSAQVISPNGTINQNAIGQIPFIPGTQINVTKGVLSVGLPDQSVIYLPEGSTLQFISVVEPNAANKESVLSLSKGAVMVKVVSGTVIVQAFDGVVARVSGSIMGVQLSDNHYVDCYEGHCGIFGSLASPVDLMDGDGRHLAVGNNQIFNANVLERCQAWETLLGQAFNQLGLVCQTEIPPTATNTPLSEVNAEATQACLVWLRDHHNRRVCP